MHRNVATKHIRNTNVERKAVSKVTATDVDDLLLAKQREVSERTGRPPSPRTICWELIVHPIY